MASTPIDLLQQMPIFGAVREDALHLLTAAQATVDVAKGDYFFFEGDPGQGMYVLESGRAAVLKSWGGRVLHLRQLGRGDCFGEMALLDLYPRSASVRAEEDCRAIYITPGDLMRLYEHDVEQFAVVQMNLAREMCRRLRLTDDMLFQVAVGEASPVADSAFATL
jgi:CRP-like cAMP-binding protein